LRLFQDFKGPAKADSLRLGLKIHEDPKRSNISNMMNFLNFKNLTKQKVLEI
jgi:hypothetical protein